MTTQRFIGPDGDYYLEWTSAWVLDIVLPDQSRIHLTHECGNLPTPIPVPQCTHAARCIKEV